MSWTSFPTVSWNGRDREGDWVGTTGRNTGAPINRWIRDALRVELNLGGHMVRGAVGRKANPCGTTAQFVPASEGDGAGRRDKDGFQERL
ncbi:hypothetical protein MLD38_031521 [Melastoma candidum]|uniref:Uncharacterized protein n=1 Tax=Melastoma candidum TaxID=119954 RepID=A0ACB9MPY2_9MYRT|nr:hypothetical protein MLD38_031521 [Melastoma candidum]